LVISVEGNAMHLSNQSLLVIIIVGIVAGWLAGRVMEGGGFGLIGAVVLLLILRLVGGGWGRRPRWGGRF
jgi:F0F1-type ATP synthase assembly protein I